MKISLTKKEVMELIKRSFPPAMIPDNHEVTEIEEGGPNYNREFIITILPKEDL